MTPEEIVKICHIMQDKGISIQRANQLIAGQRYAAAVITLLTVTE